MVIKLCLFQHIILPVANSLGHLREKSAVLRPKSSRIDPTNKAILALPEVNEDGSYTTFLPTLSSDQTAKLLAPKAPLLEHQKSFISAEPFVPTVISPTKNIALTGIVSSTKNLKIKDNKIPATKEPTLIIDVSI